MDERFDIIGPMSGCLEDRRSPVHTRHSLVQMIRQRVYQIAAGYEDGNDADYLRIAPALRLAIGKGHKMGASQSMLSRLRRDRAQGPGRRASALDRRPSGEAGQAAADCGCRFHSGPGPRQGGAGYFQISSCYLMLFFCYKNLCPTTDSRIQRLEGAR